jgi:hypothetical protein
VTTASSCHSRRACHHDQRGNGDRVGGSSAALRDTPGHARHHHCIWDEASRGWFTGDTFGIVYPELQPYIVPACAPSQFDQEELHKSVARCSRNDRNACISRITALCATPNGEPCSSSLKWMPWPQRRASLAGAPGRHEQLKRAFGDIYLGELRRSGSMQSKSFYGTFSQSISS